MCFTLKFGDMVLETRVQNLQHSLSVKKTTNITGLNVLCSDYWRLIQMDWNKMCSTLIIVMTYFSQLFYLTTFSEQLLTSSSHHLDIDTLGM